MSKTSTERSSGTYITPRAVSTVGVGVAAAAATLTIAQSASMLCYGELRMPCALRTRATNGTNRRTTVYTYLQYHSHAVYTL